MKPLFTHLDLFSGIGGLALATEMVWDNVSHIFCDNDPFSQAVLKKHWPNSLIYGDIRELTAERIASNTNSKRNGGELAVRAGKEDSHERAHRENARTGEIRNIYTESRIDLVTGGFPCQPFSAAGRRAGTEDNRHLWPEMLRVIRETNPTYVLGENVGGFLTWDGGLVLEMVLSDLESAGYEAGAFVIPACSLNAPHRRDRVWIAAHTKHESTRETERRRHDKGTPSRVTRSDTNDTNTSNEGLEGSQHEESKGHGRQLNRNRSNKRRDWTENWPEVAAELCTMDDGLPNGLARPRGWRNAALKGAGNAIVPQVAAEVLRAMRYA